MRLGVIPLVAAIVALAGCASQQGFRDPFTRPQIDWNPSVVLSVEEAERVLGNPSYLDRSTAYMDNGTKTYFSVFREVSSDPATGKTGLLYYMYEEYATAVAARSYLYSTLDANHINPADGTRTEDGTEIHYLSGGPVVRMVMVLKQNHLIRLKVNPVTSRYSLGELRNAAEMLATQL